MDYIKEGRKIAEFLGYKYIGWNNPEREKYGMGIGGIWAKKTEQGFFKDAWVVMRNPPPFHSDWNYTMRAAKFIFQMAKDLEITNIFNIKELENALASVDQPRAYKQIVHIIDLYQNKDNVQK